MVQGALCGSAVERVDFNANVDACGRCCVHDDGQLHTPNTA